MTEQTTSRQQAEIHIVMIEIQDEDHEMIGKIIDSVWMNKERAETYVEIESAKGRENLYIETRRSQD